MNGRIRSDAEQMLEELRRARDAAEAANHAKDAFLATMSHELRTPMTTVIGATQLLLETELDEEQRHAAESVHRAGKVLLGIINDVLDYSKIGSGKLELTHADFDLYAAVIDVIETLRSQAARKTLELELEVARGVPRWVKGDSLRIGQVLTNLVANAVKFTTTGSVRVFVDAEELAEGFRVSFRVVDTGIGLDTEVGRLFEPFAQGDGSTTRRYGGTGLGLAIARQLVELMGGTIDASGRPGQGSTFAFVIPLASGNERTAKLSSNPPRFWRSYSPVPGAGRKRRLLLAEDNDTNRSLILRSLAPLDCSIDTVRTGRAAADAALTTAYDAILMDCQMPEMDGFEAAREIRANEPPGRRVPIIALTANALYGDRDRCLAAGMDDYLPKPFSVAELRHKTRFWMLPEPVPLTVAASNPAAVISERMDDANDALDLDRLRELGSYGGRSLIEELAAIFVDDARRRLEDVLAAIGSGNAPELRRAAHALKGASGNVGAGRLAEIAASLENADPLSPCSAAAARTLEHELGRVQHALGEGLNALLARAGIELRA